MINKAVESITDGEFTPSPSDTEALISDQYNVSSNLIVQFSDDALDQSPRVAALLSERFGPFGGSQSESRAERQFVKLAGTHLTPNVDLTSVDDRDQAELDVLVEELCRYLTDKALWR